MTEPTMQAIDASGGLAFTSQVNGAKELDGGHTITKTGLWRDPEGNVWNVVIYGYWLPDGHNGLGQTQNWQILDAVCILPANENKAQP